MTKILSTLLLGFFIANTAAAANMFKCVDANGKTSFSDRPCAKNYQAIEEQQKEPKKSTSKQKKATGGYSPFIERARKIKPKQP